MITITLVLQVGRIINGLFQESEEYDLGSDEEVGHILNNNVDAEFDHARLLVHVTGWPDNGRTICTYKKIRTRSKQGSTHRWIVTN